METKKILDRKKIIVICLIFLLAVSAIGVSVWYGYSRRADVPQFGEEENDVDASKDDESEEEKEEAEDEVETDEQDKDEEDTSSDSEEFNYDGFKGEMPEKDNSNSTGGSLDDMKQYPTDPVVEDKDWEV